jgi:hypothetical protein
MAKPQWLIWGKGILAIITIAIIFGFWYFESSLWLKIIVVLVLAALLVWSLLRRTEKAVLRSQNELIVLLALYLGLFTLYNALYGLGIPLYLVMVGVMLLVSGLFFASLVLDKLETLINTPLLWVFLITAGLVILETFLSLSFWPIDPKIKSLIIVVIFYVITNSIYLFAHNMLKFKKILGILIAGTVILAIFILNIWFSLRGAI